MPKFKKRPIIIDAIQWDGTTIGAINILGTKEFKEINGTIPEGSVWRISTLEGGHNASPNDWIIRGVKGEYYPCKPDIFELTYEPA